MQAECDALRVEIAKKEEEVRENQDMVEKLQAEIEEHYVVCKGTG